ncbi:MAG: helix-turn-helix transcriptional regulator [Clostridia bacterium]|jgi:transcriptional regulator with XRE-family HTH domain|nr:helix-turn-helix transcriptional regulator [Clostridia bacterium]
MTIGENIQKYRKELGWSQEELARKLNVSVSTVGMIETDKRNVKDSIKLQLCSLFNISISELMGTNEINFSKLKNSIIFVFLQYKTDKKTFSEIKKETIAIVENRQYLELRKLKVKRETKEIIKVILQFANGVCFNNFFMYNIEKEDKFIQEHKESIVQVINSMLYDELQLNSFLPVISQYTLYHKSETTILKNPFEEEDKFIAIRIENEKMNPKYEKGNIVIIQKSDIFTNGQDVCFKNKTIYDIGRIYIDSNTVAIKYFNTTNDIQFFELEEFKKMYIGFVISTRLYN